MSSPYLLQMAHYALGRLEIELGHALSEWERRDFLLKFIADHELDQKKAEE